MPGFPELLFILIILAIVFGARTLPRIGAAIGRLLARDKTAAPPSQPNPSDGKGAES